MSNPGFHKQNNFDFIRLLAASMVVLSHCFDLRDAPTELVSEPLRQLTSQQLGLGILGVHIFFCLSGYLITKSMLQSRSYLTYFLKRCLRIFPALVADLLIAVFVWGALVTILPRSEYFSNPETYRYLLNVSLFKLTLTLPGVFLDNPFSQIVNGSLWTLPYEFTCYMGVALLFLLGLFRNKTAYLIFYILFLIASFYVLNNPLANQPLPVLGIEFKQFFILSRFFGAGALFYLYHDKIPLRAGISILFLGLWAVSFYFQVAIYFSYLFLPYLVFTFAFSNAPFHKWGKFGDFSYGIYIYSFSVQQTIIHYLGTGIPVWLMIIISFVGTLPLAVFSWFVIEKRALSLKDKIFRPEAATKTQVAQEV